MHRKRLEFFPRQFGFFPFIFLIYLIFPAMNIANYDGAKMFFGYGLLLLFLYTYRQLYFAAGRPSFSYWLGIQLILILPFALFFGVFNMLLGYFPGSFIGWFQDKRKFKFWMILFVMVELLCIFVNLRNLEVDSLLWAFPLFAIMLVMPFMIRSMMSRQNLERELDQANEQISELVKREERIRIARDLHDTLGHTLSLITMKSQLVEKLVLTDQARAKSEAGEIEQISRSALKQVRELVTDMKAVKINEELHQAHAMLQSAGMVLCREGNIDLKDVPDLTQNILSMCLREAVTNIVKHSRATKCTVNLWQSKRNITMVISDNGIGLHNKNESGNGLKGMSERLALIEGSLRANSANGTELTITVPLVVHERKA